ncbi:MAG: DNA/RNA nuclease SfsA [Proteobacteria bacterium]|nr:DNA/RNA nuclease SfsA [Pseudomonadota bacterium]
MRLPTNCQTGTLQRRYKRFLADILLADGQSLTVHCPNSGSMRGCSTPGSPVLISRSDNSRRKYPWTLEMVRENGIWIGVHTGRTNHLVREALESGVIDDFGSVSLITPEVKVSAGSRLDFRLETAAGTVYLEVKNCSLAENGVALFPDAITDRGAKHLRELAQLAADGRGAAVLFCVQRSDAACCAPAAVIDPVYADTVAWAAKRGVRFLAYRAEVSPQAIMICEKIPFYPAGGLADCL